MKNWRGRERNKKKNFDWWKKIFPDWISDKFSYTRFSAIQNTSEMKVVKEENSLFF